MKLTNHTNNNYKPKQLKLPFVVQKNVLIKLKIQSNLIIKKLGCQTYNELLQKVGLKKKKEALKIESNKRTIDIS